MSVFHTNAQFISRSQGKSVCAHAAYISGERIVDERTGHVADFGSKSDVVHGAVLAPFGAPLWARGAGTLWNKVEAFEDELLEKRFDGRTQRSLERREKLKGSVQTAFQLTVALQNSLSVEQNIDLLEDYIGRVFVSRGLVCQYAIHKEPGNIHAHLSVTLRALEGDTFSALKERDLFARGNFRQGIRGVLEKVINEHLAKYGLNERVTSASFESLGIDLEPSIKEGFGARLLDSRGVDTRIISENREIFERNALRILDNPQVVFNLLSVNKHTFTKQDVEALLFEKVGGSHVLFEAAKTRLEALENTKEMIFKKHKVVVIGEGNQGPIYTKKALGDEDKDFQKDSDISQDFMTVLSQKSPFRGVDVKADMTSSELLHSLESVWFERSEEGSSVSKEERFVRVGQDFQGADVFMRKSWVETEEAFFKTLEDLKTLDPKSGPGERVRTKAAMSHGLNSEQKHALEKLTSYHRVSCVNVEEGAQSAPVICAVKQAYEQVNTRVLVLSNTGRGARDLESHVQDKVQSVGSFFTSQEKASQELSRVSWLRRLVDKSYHYKVLRAENTLVTHKDVLMVNESHRLRSGDALRLLTLAKETGCQVRFIGQGGQALSFSDVGVFKALVENTPHAVLSHNTFHKDAVLKSVCGSFKRHDTGEALQTLEKTGKIHWSHDTQDTVEKIAHAYTNAYAARDFKSQSILCDTLEGAQYCNETIRISLQKSGKLGPDLCVTLDGKGVAMAFAVGDLVRFTSSGYGKVEMLEKSQNGPYGLSSGSLGFVQGYDAKSKHVTVRLENGSLVGFNPGRFKHVEHGYAHTIHAGVSEVNQVHVMLTGHASLQTMSAALTCGSHEVGVYVAKSHYKDLSDLVRKTGHVVHQPLVKDYSISEEKRPFYEVVGRYKRLCFEGAHLRTLMKEEAFVSDDVRLKRTQLQKDIYEEMRSLAHQMCLGNKDVKKTPNSVIAPSHRVAPVQEGAQKTNPSIFGLDSRLRADDTMVRDDASLIGIDPLTNPYYPFLLQAGIRKSDVEIKAGLRTPVLSLLQTKAIENVAAYRDTVKELKTLVSEVRLTHPGRLALHHERGSHIQDLRQLRNELAHDLVSHWEVIKQATFVRRLDGVRDPLLAPSIHPENTLVNGFGHVVPEGSKTLSLEVLEGYARTHTKDSKERTFVSSLMPEQQASYARIKAYERAVKDAGQLYAFLVQEKDPPKGLALLGHLEKSWKTRDRLAFEVVSHMKEVAPYLNRFALDEKVLLEHAISFERPEAIKVQALEAFRSQTLLRYADLQARLLQDEKDPSHNTSQSLETPSFLFKELALHQSVFTCGDLADHIYGVATRDAHGEKTLESLLVSSQSLQGGQGLAPQSVLSGNAVLPDYNISFLERSTSPLDCHTSSPEGHTSSLGSSLSLSTAPEREDTPSVLNTFSYQDGAGYIKELSKAYADWLIETCDEVIPLDKNLKGQESFTSKAWQSIEAGILKNASRLHNAEGMGLDASLIESQIHEIFQARNIEFSSEQIQAVRQSCSDSHLSLIQGRAGTGKTTLATAIARSYEAAGYKVMVTSFQGKAVEIAKHEIGIQGDTLHGLFQSWNRLEALTHLAKNDEMIASAREILEQKIEALKVHDLDDKTIVLVDEANMVGNALWAPLMERAANKGAKLVIMGDPSQILSLEGGDVLRALHQKYQATDLTQIIRQRDPVQKQATLAFSQHHIRQGLDSYEVSGHLKWASTHEEALTQVRDTFVEKYVNNTLKGSSVLTLASSVVIPAQAGTQKTNQSIFSMDSRLRGSDTSVCENDMVGYSADAFHTIAIAFLNRDVAILNTSIHDALKEKGVLGTPYMIQGKEFCLGERIVFTENDRSDARIQVRVPESTMKINVLGSDIKGGVSGHEMKMGTPGSDTTSSLTTVMNGSFGVLECYDPQTHEAQVRLQKGQIATFNTKEYNAIDYGYAITSNKSEGSTFEHSVVLLNGRITSNALYVAMTRHKESVTAFAPESAFTHMDGLIKHIQTDFKPMLADRDDTFQETRTQVAAFKEMGQTLHTLWKTLSVIPYADRPAHADFAPFQDTMSQRQSLAAIFLENYQEYKALLDEAGLSYDRLQEISGKRMEKALKTPEASQIPSEKPVHYDLEQVKQALSERSYDVVMSLKNAAKFNPSLSTKETLAFGAKGSFKAFVSGPKQGHWYDFEAGTGGCDMLSLIQYEMGGSFKEALHTAQSFIHLDRFQKDTLGEDMFDKALSQRRETQKQEKAHSIAKQETQKIAWVNECYESSVSLSGTLGETYLRQHRGIIGDLPQDIRFLADKCALATFARNDQGQITAFQEIRLDPQTGEKSKSHDVIKRTHGVAKNAYVTLQKGEGITYIAEGLETGLSITSCGIEGEIICGFGRSVFKNISPKNKTVVLVADYDGPNSPTHKFIEKEKELLSSKGYTVHTIWPTTSGLKKQDFNDLLRNQGVQKTKDIISYQLKELRLDNAKTLGSQNQTPTHGAESVDESIQTQKVLDHESHQKDLHHQTLLKYKEKILAFYQASGRSYAHLEKNFDSHLKETVQFELDYYKQYQKQIELAPQALAAFNALKEEGMTSSQELGWRLSYIKEPHTILPHLFDPSESIMKEQYETQHLLKNLSEAQKDMKIWKDFPKEYDPAKARFQDLCDKIAANPHAMEQLEKQDPQTHKEIKQAQEEKAQQRDRGFER